MSIAGTAAYRDLTDGLPALVVRAVRAAGRAGFGQSCRPEQGRLLHALAAGADRIGETGTGMGVGLAWLASGARPGSRLVSVERDAGRAAAAAGLFAGRPEITVLAGDWTRIAEHAPYDLLVLDGGGQGKGGGPPADPTALLRPGGTLVIDDLTPATGRPPMFDGEPDRARLHWFERPDLDAVEVRLAPDLAAVLATRRHPGPA